ncbi:MAG: MarR family transcriptional regulator [Alphaproteobacteria bacterium]|nr:MarR family transcriptional regulator [Alphaproteobacteria bacterium]
MARPRGPDDSPGILLWRAANAWQRDIRGLVKSRGLTQAQFVLLSGLHHLEARTVSEPAPTTQRALAAYCGVDTTMASQVLRQLEAAGQLRRAPGADARSRALYLTDRGRQTVTELEPEVRAVDAKFFAVLGGNAEMFKAALQVLIGLPPRLGSSRRS